MTFDKYAWIRAVYADDAFSHAHKCALVYAAIFGVLNGTDTFRVQQRTIAARCGVSYSKVKEAVALAKQRGYLAVAQERKRGTGQHNANELRLLLPELGPESGPHSEKLGPGSGPHSPELGPGSSPSWGQNRAELGPESGPTYRNTGLGNGSVDGVAPRPELQPDPGPHSEDETDRPPTCSKHPNGPDHEENCQQCGYVRKWWAEAPQRAEAAKKRDAKRRTARIAACKAGCGGTGWIEAEHGDAVGRCVCNPDPRMAAQR